MKEYQSLCHTKWDCKYHVVFIPKRRKKMIFGAIRKHLGESAPSGASCFCPFEGLTEINPRLCRG